MASKEENKKAKHSINLMFYHTRYVKNLNDLHISEEQRKKITKILPNLNAPSLELIDFVIKKQNETKEHVKSGEILNHLKKIGIKKDYYQKIRERLIKHHILFESPSTRFYYYIPQHISRLFINLFKEEEKIIYMDLPPGKYHYNVATKLEIKKEYHTDLTIYKIEEAFRNMGYPLLKKETIDWTINGKKDQGYNLCFYNEPFIDTYLQYIYFSFLTEYSDTFDYALVSDIHITEKHDNFENFIKHKNKNDTNNKISDIRKKWAGSICRTNFLNSYQVIKSIIPIEFDKIHELESSKTIF